MIKLNWPDRLRILATVMVIAIHVCAPIPFQRTDYDTTDWWAGNLWCSFSRPAVPLFVMLSGFLLLSRKYPLGEFLNKRFLRVVIPAIAWMTLYSVYNHFGTNNPATIWDALRGVIVGPVHYHLWFLYLIIGLYLSYPILAPFARQATDQEMWFFVVVCLYGTWGIKTLMDFFDIKSMLHIELFCNNIMYFVGGMWLALKPCSDEIPVGEPSRFRPWRVTRAQMRLVSFGLILLGLVTTAVFSYVSSKAQGSFFNFYYDYLTPTVTIGAVGWFLFAKYSFNSGALAQWETDLAAASFGMYLAHPLILDWWSAAGYWQDKYHPALCIPVMLGLTTILTFIGISVIRVLPGGKQVT